ncbi:MAG: hypothetical protein KF770_21870 [Anaerolineae bacterium]|nr:hypothetical protein [Anaerolineae bacterium]
MKILLLFVAWILVIGWAMNDGRTTATTAVSRGPSGRQLVGNTSTSATTEGPLVIESAPPQLSRPVRELPIAQPEPKLERELNPRQNPFVNFPLDFPNVSGPMDPLLQIGATNNGRTPTPTLTFEGMEQLLWLLPAGHHRRCWP